MRVFVPGGLDFSFPFVFPWGRDPGRREMHSQREWLRPAVAAVALMLVACARAEDGGAEAKAAWDVVRTEGDGVVEVDNRAGGKWGGDGALREMLSIGGPEADEPYQFVAIAAIWPTEDRILVVDYRIPAVRAYDAAGSYLHDFGRAGQGPGEWEQPIAVAVVPDGTVTVLEPGVFGRVHRYRADGEVLETWTYPDRPRFGREAAVIGDRVVVHTQEFPGGLPRPGTPPPPGWTTAVRALGPDGVSEKAYVSLEETAGGDSWRIETGQSFLPIPYRPGSRGGMGPDGTVARGHDTEYEIDLYRPAGEILRVRRWHEPVPVRKAEREHLRAFLTAQMRKREPQWTWSGPEIPAFKPALASVVSGRGRILVSRHAESTLAEGCQPTDDDPAALRAAESRSWQEGSCWEQTTEWDLFDADGDFLGTVPRPEGGIHALFVDGDRIYAAIEDDAGVVWIKGWEVVPPMATDDP